MAESTSESTTESGPTTEPVRSALRVVRGDPTVEELAALTAVVAAAGASAEGSPREAPRGRWSDPAHTHRRPVLPGPGAWRAAVR
jgi:Acyl-CoA carboxylase epsilon subunit